MLSKVQIKTIHALQHKKYRQKSGRFLAEGVKIVEELLQSTRIEVETIYGLSGWIEKQEQTRGVQMELITERELKSISMLATPQEVLAVCKIPPQTEKQALTGPVVLLLESLRDPGNLGTIIRIADWFGLSEILCSPDCVDPYNPKTVQATMGSIARIQLLQAPIAAVLAAHPGWPVVATTLDGCPLTKCSPLKQGFIAIGNESNGLSKELIRRAHQKITIPRLGQAESLNAAIATGIVCSHLLL